jgi:sugar phosphate isomerase/epimerase
MSRLVAGCRALCDVAAARNVNLAFEPEPGMFIDTTAGFLQLAQAVDHPRFGLTLDVGHLHCQGEPIAETIRANADRLRNVHVEDMRRGVHEHLMFGDGEIDFPPAFQTLEEMNYGFGVLVELSRHSHDAVEAARRSIKFLRATLAGRAGDGNVSGVSGASAKRPSES